MCAMYFKSSLLLLLWAQQVWTEQCYTPEQQEGTCIPLHACRKMLNAFANPPKGSEEYLRQFICQRENEIKVCCGISPNFTILAEQHSDPVTNITPIPISEALPECSTISPADVVLPLIRVKHANCYHEYTKCIGVLLNSRYILAAAECVVPNNETGKFVVVGIRFPLREQNSKDVGIEEVLPHPFYDPIAVINNLALLRLNETISADYVAPLCLNDYWSTSFQRNPDEQSFDAYSGLDDLTVEEWRNKTTISTTFASTCKQMLETIGIAVTAYDFCTTDYKSLPHTTIASCNHFTGVPLLRKTRETRLYGISSSRTACFDGFPDVYTDVLSYRDWILDNLRPWSTNNDKCTTPNGDLGYCQFLLSCPTLWKAFSNARNDSIEYLRKFICEETGYSRDFSVCCPISANSTSEDKRDIQSVDVPAKFLEEERCGLQHRDDYFANSDDLTIDEFPWIALIEKINETQYYSKCTATLINARYVLTVARCARADANETIVRLGDYNQLNETACVVEDEEFGWVDCTDTEKFGVEEIIRHPYYILTPNTNNIALMRLNKTVYYSDFIRPICLPVPGTALSKVGDLLYISGWDFNVAESIETKKEKGIKKKVPTRLISIGECQRRIRKENFQYVLNLSNMCSVGYGNSTEYDNSLKLGGALMFERNYRWQVEGLLINVWLGSGLPVQYLNVTKHMNWILGNMRTWK